MSISATFIKRPVATSLLTIALALAGAMAYRFLPVSPLPQVEFPTIQVSAALPGASPETMASSVAMPLERQFGRIAGVTDMTSTSNLGSTTIVLQFDLSRNIDAAARDVQAAINAARGQLPSNLPNNPQYRKVNPADAPIVILALTSETVEIRPHVRCGRLDPAAEALAGGGRRPGVRGRQLAARGARRSEPHGPEQLRHRPGPSALGAERGERQPAQGATRGRNHGMGDQHDRPAAQGRTVSAADRHLSERSCGPTVRCR